MSQHQNPQEVLQSLQQPTILGSDNGQSDLKPFSIREYVQASRQKDIFHSWPFPEKYLNMFLNHGIENVLPPFEPHHLAIQSLSGRGKRLNGSQPVKEDVAVSDHKTHRSNGANLSKSDETVSEICNPNGHLSPSNKTDKDEEVNDCRCKTHPYNGAVYSRRSKMSKRNTSEVKRTKKYVVDLSNVAKSCTSQNLERVRRLRRGLSKHVENGVKKNEKLTKCESELTDDQFLESKLRMGDCEGASLDMVGAKKWALKFKCRGLSSQNSRNKTLRGKELKVLQRRK